jgi:uncharacterized damage-inducible protein DinB
VRLGELLLLDFDAEARKTQSYFAAMPEDKVDFRPHALSPTLGSLAKHVANVQGFGAVFLTTETMDATGGPPALPKYQGRADLLQTFDGSCAKVRELLGAASDEFLLAPWAFTAGDKILEQAPRVAMFQEMCLHHTIHHRGQMGVYLRLLGVSLPGLYGPSADGAWEPAWPGPKQQPKERTQ